MSQKTKNTEKLISAFTELRCSAISSPITPSIDHTVIPSLTEHITSDFMDSHYTYQPLVHRTSMGNNEIFVKCPSSENGNSCSNENVATGTEGLLIVTLFVLPN